MRLPPEIRINHFKLAVLLTDDQIDILDAVIAGTVFFAHCGDVCNSGITIEEVFLTDLNDIHVKGTCNTCNGKVARLIEFGEDQEFYNKAMDFRKSIQN